VDGLVSDQRDNCNRRVGAVIDDSKRKLEPVHDAEFVTDVPAQLGGSGRQRMRIKVVESWPEDGESGVQSTSLGW